MKKDVIGQSEPISQVCNALFKSHCGLKDPSRPIGSFLFLGKTGVGKTLTSKSLARHYFGSDNKLISFDMSEFSESIAASKFSVVLQSLLQVLEEGRMTDNSGEETSFKNTIIIFTSNLGADIIDKHGSVGFLPNCSSNKSKILEEARKSLSPELINRFDGISLFNNFSDDELKKIINIELSKVRKKLKLKNISIKFSASVKNQILNQTISENLGGRPIRRIIQNEVEVCIAKFIIHNECKSVNITFKDNQFLCNEQGK